MSSATYVYAVVAADIDLPEGLTPVGGGEEVAVIDHGRLAAVVSDVPRDAPLGSREDLLAHERTVNTLAGSTTVLPMRFGGVVDDDRAVVDELLAAHQEYFAWALEQLDGCRQFVLAGRYDSDRLVAGIVEADPEIQQLGEAVRGKDPDATYYERIRLGEAIAGHVERIRSDDADLAVERLGPFAVATSVKEPASEDGAVELALLVHRDRVGDFEQAVDALGDEWDERVRLRLIGPVAPYDFLPEPPEAEG
ncbi:GvpL/GvpF family gas vesicle protein [Pseudonocardia alni]|uniref:GvpL/GvpF family gas vesicle protein n=1 Tax=Pseudonocardia alni TaxID=33907 RepID=UPI00280BB672|nr:GvpL/GvpF family gas vesicle protein [Pseudonocardia alni]